jgi:hypothetical protein
MPIRLSKGANGFYPALLLRYYADLIEGGAEEEIRPAAIGHTIVRREPVGWWPRSRRGTIRRRWPP